MTFIWVTRGRSWGFTFLATAGLTDPLASYENATLQLEGGRRGCVRVGDVVALKFNDPEGRQDRSGRPISHTFVLYGELAERVTTLDDGIREVWPLVSARYAAVWDQPTEPQSID